MRYMRGLIYVFIAIAATEYLSNCCHGEVMSVDCGNPQFRASSTNPAASERKMSLVSSMLRNRLASLYKPKYTCWPAKNVSELQLSINENLAIGSEVGFSLNKSSLENITGARFSFYMTLPKNSHGGTKLKPGRVQVQGTHSGLHGTLTTLPLLFEEVGMAGVNNNRLVVARHFSASDFLQRAMKQMDSKDAGGKTPYRQYEPQEQAVMVNFFITRFCNCQILARECCSTLVKPSVHTPSLRVFYA